MKIKLEKFNPDWINVYNEIKIELKQILRFLNPEIEHIGSTSVFGLASKPIIDILVGITDQENLDKTVEPLMNKNYIFYEKYNTVMPYRRFFVKLKTKPDNFIVKNTYYENDNVPNELNDHKLAHIHILQFNSYHWTRHIAFREYLKHHMEIKDEYQSIKMNLSTLEWRDGNEYNSAKNDFIKKIEQKAIEWYKKEFLTY